MASMILNEQFYLLKVIHLATRLEPPMIYFTACLQCSFIWNFCHSDVTVFSLPMYQFVFFNNSQTLLFAVAMTNKEMQIRKLIVFLSNRKRLQINVFSFIPNQSNLEVGSPMLFTIPYKFFSV